MNRFGPTQSALASNFDNRANALMDGTLPTIDDTLEALWFGESPEQIEVLEDTGAAMVLNNPYMHIN